jgi:S1-C subfamily serine protease
MRLRLVPTRAAGRTLLVLLLGATLLSGPRPVFSQGTLSALETDVDQISRSARPSVVTILAHNTTVRRTRRGEQESRTHIRVGSGVAVDEQWIMTTASVVQGAERLMVRTTNGLQVAAQVAGTDPISNLALLRVTEIRLPVLKFSTSRAPQEGEWVMAIGTSHYRAQITQSVGTIAYRHLEPRLSLLQLTNTVYPGYSGGAVLNARGELIGLVQGELGARDPATAPGNSSFVMPIETVRPVYESLRREGRVRHGYLGVSTKLETVEAEAKDMQIPLGARVESAQSGGPAARAGLVRGDLIVAFDRARVEYPEQLARWVAASRPGSVIELTWVRNDTPITARITLTESPELVPQWALSAPTPATPTRAPQTTRIADLERQIQRLNRELERLKNETGGQR